MPSPRCERSRRRTRRASRQLAQELAVAGIKHQRRFASVVHAHQFACLPCGVVHTNRRRTFGTDRERDPGLTCGVVELESKLLVGVDRESRAEFARMVIKLERRVAARFRMQ